MNNLAKLNPDTPPVETWPEPQALTGPELEREPYPCDALPDGLRAAIDDVAATTQAPFAMCATSALAALSVAAQGHCDVQRNSQLKGPTSLFCLVLAESGERKSTVDKFFTEAILAHQKEQAELMKPDVKKYTAELMAWAAQKNGIQESIKQAAKKAEPTLEDTSRLIEVEAAQPIAPKVPRFIFGDATPEALIYELHKSWPSGGVISSEGGVIFGSHGMSPDSVMRNLANMNILWDGGQIPISRKTSESFTVDGARLTVCVAIQYPVLAEFLSKAGDIARGSGFLARFLVAWPESTQGSRPYKEPGSHLPGLDKFNARITALLNQPFNFDETGNGIEPKLLKLSSEAKSYWIEFYNMIELQLKPTGSLTTVRDVASKVADNAARVAGLFHCYEHGLDGQISVESMQAACDIVTWHLSESQRLFGELAQDPAISMAAKIDGWLIARCNVQGTSRLTLTEVLQFGPIRILRKKPNLLPVLDELFDANRAQLVTVDGKKLIAINPRLINGG
jgi:putative DNA primase/helicase